MQTMQAQFYVEGGGQLPPNLSLAPNIWLQQQYAVVKPANSYTGLQGAFLEVGVVDLVVLACVIKGDV